MVVLYEKVLAKDNSKLAVKVLIDNRLYSTAITKHSISNVNLPTMDSDVLVIVLLPFVVGAVLKSVFRGDSGQA